MLADGTIETAISNLGANVVLARKKDGILRFCSDCRQLNSRIKNESYPFPQNDDCLDAVSSGGWFSTLDLRNRWP